MGLVCLSTFIMFEKPPLGINTIHVWYIYLQIVVWYIHPSLILYSKCR